MKQEVIDRFNMATGESDKAFERAKNAGFPWQYFMERAQAKASASGFLPEEGAILIEARYVNSAERVVNDMFGAIGSAVDPDKPVGFCTPWQDFDLDRWMNVICSLTCSMFDAGVVASMTRTPAPEDDPVLKNGGLAIFGDVGFEGLREKSVDFVRHYDAEIADNVLPEVGDCACLHLYADKCNSETVFKLAQPLREAYVRGACRAAYLAGSVFGEIVRKAGER